MLLCDKCNRGYHTSCLSPPMKAIPEGEWSCQRCDSKRAQLKGKGSVPTARKAAAPRTLMTDSDSDGDDFQAPPSRPAGRLTARQGTLAGVAFCCSAPSKWHVHSCMHSFVYSFDWSVGRSSVSWGQSVSQSFIPSFTPSFIQSFTCSSHDLPKVLRM